MIIRRFISFLIDYFILFFVLTILSINYGINESDGTRLEGMPAAVFLFFYFFYMIFLEVKTGGTLGNHLLNLKVVSINIDKKPTFFQIFIRRLFDFIDFPIVAFCLLKYTNKNQRLGDIMSDTYIVYKHPSSPLPED